ncbi:mannose-1-phosphate guanylyltransferase/mannose-6-phosphate isomerase [Campylobacter lanienae]|uniref:mannose-1-phosphate guanylyltransferase/mannose-6-phosphate isomerase n=1 Tax=Campylobacter lanienae TaxID=75658 RepID=UPI000BB4396F|nr:mannose-1-phosphate guanylyltransferase/mannose-6-phosphate isomerase [Campylobacter lanienae]
MTNVILCGGSGTRLWPLSRKLMPKQFLPLFDDKSLFELTYDRNFKICDNIVIVANEEQYFLALDQLGDKKAKYILESLSKNTAAAITLAALSLPKDEIVLVTPSDHIIKDEIKYNDIIQQAVKFANDDCIVIFGVEPTYPETGYGYIKFNNNDVIEFVEKPNLQRASEFVNSNEYLWNSGMFVFKVSYFLKQMKELANEIYTLSLNAYNNSIKFDNIIKIQTQDMMDIPSISIDYALIEKSNNIKIIKADVSWSDVGSFESLSKELKKDDNYINVKNRVIESKNNFFYSQDKNKFIAAIGVDDLVVVDTKDALLITKKSESQRVKEIYEYIKDIDELSKTHLNVHRPWGTYTILENEFGYKIKKIEVKPGKKLSLQKHFHRNEHWIVLSGTATVEIDNNTFTVCPNESIYIKMGQKHRLINDGKIPIVLIEAQVGEYTNEDDIVRFDDDFGRKDII